jgi:hypothetical protein
MSNPPYLKGFAALLANAVLLAISIDLVTYAGGLIALRAYNLNLACENCAFGIDDSRRITGLAGLYMLFNHVDALNNYLTLFGAYLEHLALLAAIFIIAGKEHYGVAYFYVKFIHILVPPLKYFGSERKNLGIILLT